MRKSMVGRFKEGEAPSSVKQKGIKPHRLEVVKKIIHKKEPFGSFSKYTKIQILHSGYLAISCRFRFT
jgi:hypothetical protein